MHTFPAHAHREALRHSAMLALISMMLVDGTFAIPPTGIIKVSPHTPLEEAFASCNEMKNEKN